MHHVLGGVDALDLIADPMYHVKLHTDGDGQRAPRDTRRES
jgi:hypothetical protein